MKTYPALKDGVCMTAVLRRFIRGERAQDLIEWSLLLALVVLGSAALMWNSSGPAASVWTAANAALQGSPAGNGSTSGTPTTTTGGTSSGSGSGSGGAGYTGGGDDTSGYRP